MKERYEELQCEVVTFERVDVISTSTNDKVYSDGMYIGPES